MFFKSNHTSVLKFFYNHHYPSYYLMESFLHSKLSIIKKINKLSSSLWSRNLPIEANPEGKYMIEMVLFLRIIKQRLP